MTLNLKHISLLVWGFTSVHYLWLHSPTTKNESFFWLDSFQRISWAGSHNRSEPFLYASNWTVRVLLESNCLKESILALLKRHHNGPEFPLRQIWRMRTSKKECGLRSSPNINLFDGHKSINHVESTISARFFGCRCQPGTFIVLLLLLTLGRWHDVPR